MSERLAERGKKPPFRLLLIRNGMPKYIKTIAAFKNLGLYSNRTIFIMSVIFNIKVYLFYLARVKQPHKLFVGKTALHNHPSPIVST